MTSIVATASPADGKIIFGADSQVSMGWSYQNVPGAKLFKIGHLIVGVSGGFREAQLLEYMMPDLEAQDASESDMRYLVRVVAEAVGTVLKDAHGVARSDNNVADVSLLLGYRGQLYSMSGAYDIVPLVQNYGAIGSGFEYAMGALSVMHKDNDVLTEAHLQRALEVAAQYDVGTSGPFTFRVMAGK